MTDQRIYEHPYLAREMFKREHKIRFEFDGHEYDAYDNESIGAALVAAGIKTVSRSFKYHRPAMML